MKRVEERSFWMMLLLTFITCGIYGIYFWYQYGKDINVLCEGDGKETMNFIYVFLLSLVTFGIFYYIWVYQLGNRMADNRTRYGLDFPENGTSMLLWMLIGAMLCGIGALYGQYLLIKNINSMADAYNGQQAQQPEITM